MPHLPEPWSSAEIYLDAHGARAEAEVKHLARTLTDKGFRKDGEKLYEVYRAIRTMRRSASVIH